DCRSLAMRAVPLPDSLAIVVVESGVRHALAAGEYNTRRRECEEAVALLARRRPAIRALRDVGPEDLDAAFDELPVTIARRCRHVVTENARVAAAVAALEEGRIEALGPLFAASHAS